MNTERTSGRHILLVENDPEDAKRALSALAEIHLAKRVAAVCDSEKALDYLCRRGEFKDRPDGDPVVVLLDLQMPQADGLEVLKRIKSDEHLKTIPVVVLSSSNELSDVASCYTHSANAYVRKPADINAFTAMIQRLCAFWIAVNEPPPRSEKKENLPGTPGKEQVINEVPPLYPASGG